MINPDNKERILKGANELFKKYGIRSISMDDIGHHLSMSKKTIYQIFSEKDELVFEVIKIKLFYLRKAILDLKREARNPVNELCQLYVILTNTFEEMNATLIYDIQKYHPKSWEYVLNFKIDFIKGVLVENIKLGAFEGYFRENIDADISAIFTLELVKMIYNEKIYPHSGYTREQLQKNLFEQFIQGILTAKGKKLYQKNKSSHE